MKHGQFQLAILSAGTIVALQLQFLTVFANTIRYSWSGQLVPSGEDDPWQIGEQGQPFALDLAVSSTASDLLDANVEFAAFDVDEARFVLGGDELLFSGNGNVDFTDNHAGLFDLLVFHGDFERLGQIIDIGSLTVLPMASFQFSQTIESPPLFPSTINLDRSACCGGLYTSIIAAGSAVRVVGEPASVGLWAASCLLIVVAPGGWKRGGKGVRVEKGSELFLVLPAVGTPRDKRGRSSLLGRSSFLCFAWPSAGAER
ncbi:MAG: hypothetical protein WD738_21405 [Pirellulales bacterium]